jgi:nitrogen PTS system EIIA component
VTLADFTRPGLTVPHLQGRDAPGIIHELSMELQRESCVADWLPFYHEAVNREFLMSSDLEADVAIPHARVPEVRALAFAFGRSDNPIIWAPKVMRPVRLVFLVALPFAEQEPRLALISGVARLVANSNLLETLRQAVDTAAIMAVFHRVDLRGLGP